jgi:hypothetical protein
MQKQTPAIHRRTPFPFLALKTGRLNSLDSAARRFVPAGLSFPIDTPC